MMTRKGNLWLKAKLNKIKYRNGSKNYVCSLIMQVIVAEEQNMQNKKYWYHGCTCRINNQFWRTKASRNHLWKNGLIKTDTDRLEIQGYHQLHSIDRFIKIIFIIFLTLIKEKLVMLEKGKDVVGCYYDNSPSRPS